MKKNYLIWMAIIDLLFSACSTSKQIGRLAKNDILKNKSFTPAHTGISIYEPGTGKYWYNYQGDKYFVPASNTKLATCYAAMKYLGDSLVGVRYIETSDTLIVIASGDPTFLHPDFSSQPVFNFLKNTNKSIFINTSEWKEHRWGSGWSWDDYNDDYAAERSAMPAYGNILRLGGSLNNLKFSPGYFKNDVHVDYGLDKNLYPGATRRDIAGNNFMVTETSANNHYTETPFYTGDDVLEGLLTDTLHKPVFLISYTGNYYKSTGEKEIHSQPVDTLLKILIHRSDNFFAEQSLLMVSDRLLRVMNDEQVIDTLLKTDFKDLPQKPYWVDGSGLSHYNLFSPQDFVAILNKMKNEFGIERIKNILPTGGTGTLSNYYKAERGYIFAKTGTLSGVVALSGFLYTKKNKLVIFSVLVNNHHTNGTNIRRAVEKFIEEVRDKK
ncbi:MAG: D-alanyl-D-alanine carboxypeptidase [Ginsengibacter sp.]